MREAGFKNANPGVTNDDVTARLQGAWKKITLIVKHFNHDHCRNSSNAKPAPSQSVAILPAATRRRCLGEIAEDVCGNGRGPGGEWREQGQPGQVVGCRGTASFGAQPPVLHRTQPAEEGRADGGDRQGRSPRASGTRRGRAEQLVEERFRSEE